MGLSRYVEVVARSQVQQKMFMTLPYSVIHSYTVSTILEFPSQLGRFFPFQFISRLQMTPEASNMAFEKGGRDFP